MGADKKKIESLMGEVFGKDEVVKTELSMEEAGKLTQAVLCKAIDPETSDDEAAEVVKRGRALVTAIAEQEGEVRKAEGSEMEFTVYLIEKALVEALVADTEGVKVTGTWGSNMDALKSRFEKKADDEKGDEESDGKSDDSTDDNREDTQKNAGDDSDGDDSEDEEDESVWNRTHDLNTKPLEDEDWGKDPDSIKS